MKIRTKRSLIAFVLLLLIALGAWVADSALKRKRHAGLPTFLRQLVTNYPSSFQVQPLLLSITVDQQDLDRLQQVVDDALERGVIMPEGRDYVPAELENGDERFKARIRIKGKMTDHVQGSKWSFRVVAKKDGGFLGMKRFSLQHPGTRNYLHEWIHQQLSRGEGIIALRYGFIRVQFNGEDLGIYAYEEHFGPELLENNARVEGPLFRFDPSLFWQHRLNSMNKLRYNEPFAEYQAAALDAFGTSDMAKDSVALRRFSEATALMDAFRRGGTSASQIFDADRLARRHALLDLLGGHHSMDWSDVKFYYDPVRKLIEPVAYESFSVYPIRTLAGSGRYTGRSGAARDLHDGYFNDPVLFRAYVQHLERMSRPAYLDSAFKAMAPALDSISAIVYQEFPWKEPDRGIMQGNQRMIRKLLDVPKGFHAYHQGVKNDTLLLMAVPIEALPIEVFGLVLPDGSLLPPVQETIVPVRSPAALGEPFPMRFVVPAGTVLPKAIDMKLRYAVLGSAISKELDVFPQQLLEGLPTVIERRQQHVDHRTWPFVVVDEAARVILLRSGSWILDSDLEIPAGYTVQANAPFRLDLVKGARIESRSPIQFRGVEEMPVVIGSSDRSGGAVLVDAEGRSVWKHVRYEGFGAGEGASLVFRGGELLMEDCVLGEDRSRDLLLVLGGKAQLKNVDLVGGRDQLVSAFAGLRVAGCSFQGGGDEALVFRGGSAMLRNVEVLGASGSGIKLDAGAEVEAQGLLLRVKGKGIDVSEAARLVLEQATINTSSFGIDVQDAVQRRGPSSVTLNEVRVSSGKEMLRAGNGNTIIGTPVRIEDNDVRP